MSSIVAKSDEAAKEPPMHIDVKELTFGYAGREVSHPSMSVSSIYQ